MRRVIKLAESNITKQQLVYKDGKNGKLRNLLADEQHNICAYTETYLAASDDAHIEHFNPTLKGKTSDNYENWFLVKSLWNTRKSTKWADHQPVLHPTAEDFEQRIIYIDGDYAAADPNDTAARNLIQLLDLDNARLANQRKRYIELKRREIQDAQKTAQQFMNDLLILYPEGVYFIRAVEEEFKVEVDFDLLKP